MTDKEKQIQLAMYRLKQADECIDEAIYLLRGKKSPRSIVNRTYYGMFYAVLSLLIFEPFSSSKHSGVLSYFNKRFIKEGILPKELGQTINAAFELRQRTDYREYVELTYREIEPLITKAKLFIQTVKKYLRENVFNGSPKKHNKKAH
ncbi:MAG TPA: HEPN domain-containing protein [bacterium]|nr:HEPN domain-containing protein [bacterium]HPP29738.1 HEPN domain-containing protein [bacterium]